MSEFFNKRIYSLTSYVAYYAAPACIDKRNSFITGTRFTSTFLLNHLLVCLLFLLVGEAYLSDSVDSGYVTSLTVIVVNVIAHRCIYRYVLLPNLLVLCIPSRRGFVTHVRSHFSFPLFIKMNFVVLN